MFHWVLIGIFIDGMLYLFISTEAIAQYNRHWTDSLEIKLYQKGYDNVVLLEEDSSLLLTYENRIYRNEIRAIRDILALLLPVIRGRSTLVLIPQHKSIPVLSIVIPVDAYLSFLQKEISHEVLMDAITVSFSVDQYWKRLRQEKLQTYRLDLVLHPQIKLQLGDFEDPIESQLNLIPEINLYLWRGMAFSAQMIIPFQNELEEEGNSFRPGSITFNQTVRLPADIFLSTTLGNFNRNRYGAEMNFRKYFRNATFYIGMDVGYTGHATYLDHTWYYQRIDYLTAFFQMGYRIQAYDLFVHVLCGQFLQEDQGIRVEVTRQFNSVSIGFLGIWTQHGHDMGFNFSIPLFPAKLLQTKAFRVRPAREFTWEYRYQGFESIGFQYSTGNAIDPMISLLHPDFIKKQLSNLLRNNPP